MQSRKLTKADMVGKLIERNIQMCHTEEQLQSANNLVTLYNRMFDPNSVRNMRALIQQRREALHMEAQEKLIKSKRYGSTWDWIRSMRGASSDITGMACHITRETI